MQIWNSFCFSEKIVKRVLEIFYAIIALGFFGIAVICGYGAGAQATDGSSSGALFMALLAGFFGWISWKLGFES